MGPWEVMELGNQMQLLDQLFSQQHHNSHQGSLDMSEGNHQGILGVPEVGGSWLADHNNNPSAYNNNNPGRYDDSGEPYDSHQLVPYDNYPQTWQNQFNKNNQFSWSQPSNNTLR